MKSSASIATLAPALVAALAEIGGVAKGKTNPHFKSKYATLENVIEASKGILANHGIALMQFPSAFAGGAMSLDTILLHESGEWLSGEEAFGVATGKQDPQAVGSALTYARRYAQMAVLNMPALDDDGEAAMPRPQVANEPRRDTGPGPVDGKDFYGCSGHGQSSHAAKKAGLDNVLDAMRIEIDALPTTAALREWIEKNREDIAPMPKSWRSILRDECDERAKELGFDPEKRAA